MVTFGKLQRSKPGSKTWYVRVNDNGRRTWRSTKTEDFQAARTIVAQWQVGEGSAEVSKIVLGVYVKKYLEWKKPRVAHTTYHTTNVYCSLFIRHWGAHRPLASISVRDCEDFLTRLANEEKRRATTINAIRGVLITFFSWGVRQKYLATNPAKETAKLPEQQQPIRVLTSDEEDKLLAAAKQYNEEVWLFTMAAMYTGLRRGTLERLNWEDVDLERGVWRIPAGKMKARRAFHGVPVEEGLLAVLKEREGAPCDRMFVPPDQTDWLRVVSIAGIPDVRLHDLRRNFVTRCRRAGVPLEAACALGGWSDVRVVMKHYRAVDEGELRDSLKAAFGGKSNGEG